MALGILLSHLAMFRDQLGWFMLLMSDELDYRAFAGIAERLDALSRRLSALTPGGHAPDGRVAEDAERLVVALERLRLHAGSDPAEVLRLAGGVEKFLSGICERMEATGRSTGGSEGAGPAGQTAS